MALFLCLLSCVVVVIVGGLDQSGQQAWSLTVGSMAKRLMSAQWKYGLKTIS